MKGYPIELDLRGRKAVVVGLGRVGLRKAKGLVEAEALVVGVDPLASVSLNGVRIIAEPYRADHLNGAVLVFAAAAPEVNRQVVHDANSARILVNTASDPNLGCFRLPMYKRDGPLLITVSTTGSSPSLARRLLERLTRQVDPSVPRFARILGELRPLIIKEYPDIRIRKRIFEDLADLDRLRELSRKDDGEMRISLFERAKRIAGDESERA